MKAENEIAAPAKDAATSQTHDQNQASSPARNDNIPPHVRDFTRAVRETVNVDIDEEEESSLAYQVMAFESNTRIAVHEEVETAMWDLQERLRTAEAETREANMRAIHAEGDGIVARSALKLALRSSTDDAPTTSHESVAIPIWRAVLDKAPVRRYSTGFAELDALIGGGLTTRQLAVLMAPPGDGKSALAVSIASHVQRTIPVLYASTELESDEIAARVAAPILGRPWREIVDGRVPHEVVREVLAGLAIRVIGCESLPRGEDALTVIESEALAMQVVEILPDGSARLQSPLVIVDYLQDLSRGVGERDVRARIGDLASRLRAMAQGLDCPMLVISSVSRAFYGAKRQAELRAADDPTVYLAAAKESGDVDYAAAVVIMLDVLTAEPGASHRIARLAVAKSRHGNTGFVGARFTGATGEWRAGTDEIVAAAGRRADRDLREANMSDDATVLAAVLAAAAKKEYRTRRGWRDLVPGVSERRNGESMTRLIATGRLQLAPLHPVHGTPPRGGGSDSGYVVPPASPLTPRAPTTPADLTSVVQDSTS